MSVVLKRTGGARIGWVGAGWPFARLTAAADQLSLSMLLSGSYTFSPKDIVTLEPYGWIPVLGRGVRIIHTNPDYPEKIIFWCTGNPGRLIQQISALGFIPRAQLSAVPKREGIAFRWSFIIAVIVVWNALFLLDGFVPSKEPTPPGASMLLALILLFLTATAASRSTAFQSLVLKPGRSVAEIRPMLRLVQFVSLVILIAFGAQYLAS